MAKITSTSSQSSGKTWTSAPPSPSSCGGIGALLWIPVQTISLTNFGEMARSPAYLWTIGLAACSEKEMETLGELWDDNIKVHHRLFLCASIHVSPPGSGLGSKWFEPDFIL